ncbi:hypothetical protein [Bradyrhizobium prioriisuperbiae]|uniref:hypothetical protein n=1 Tax=Bradyrhizobium prioriisuperbiae TaxID=2854389 RepID=UPI0028E7CB2C|nr:hypothetical protein [Bradyrhizobium prioritasuperba]
MIIKERDLYTQSTTAALMSSGTRIGTTTIQYEVRRYVDTRNLTSTNSFVVTCTQRFFVPNGDPFSPTAQQVTGFVDYPALITNGITFSDPDSIVSTILLLDYAPKTMNTSVTTSQNAATSTGTTNTQEYSSGSSVAQTNSYGGSLSLGFFGKSPTGDIGISGSKSSTNESSWSQGSGHTVDSGAQYSNDASMAIKDWGSYAQLDATTNCWPTWIWGQEYPWDLIDFRNTDENDNIVLPQYVIDRLYDGTQVYPPSELALLGVNFASKASWLVTLKAGTTDTTSLDFDHALTLCVATHQLQSSALVATIRTYQPATETVTNLDLARLALDPIGGNNGAAMVGFIPTQFDAAPTSTGGPFQIRAESNLMLVRGSGFTGASQTGFMTTDFSAGTVTLTLYFKVLETSEDVSLSFKHWVENGGVTLSIQVNGGTTITRLIDAPEAGGGGDNVTVVPLRRKDFTSVDFCDLLSLGTNTVVVTFAKASSGSAANYTLMAIAAG